jgi:hypothetical protein
MNGNTGSNGLRVLSEDLGVDFVHCSEVIHGSEKDVDFDNVVDAASCCLEDSRKVCKTLSLYEY